MTPGRIHAAHPHPQCAVPPRGCTLRDTHALLHPWGTPASLCLALGSAASQDGDAAAPGCAPKCQAATRPPLPFAPSTKGAKPSPCFSDFLGAFFLFLILASLPYRGRRWPCVLQTQEPSLLPAGTEQGKAVSTVKRLRSSCTKPSARCGKGVTQHLVPKRKTPKKKQKRKSKKQLELTFQNALRFVAMFSSRSHQYPSCVSTHGPALELGVIPTVFMFYFFGCANVGRLENKLWRILEERLQTALGGMTNPIAAESNGALKIARFLTINIIKSLADNKQPQKSQKHGEVCWKWGWEGASREAQGWEGCGCHMVHSCVLCTVQTSISVLGFLFQLRAARGAADADGTEQSRALLLRVSNLTNSHLGLADVRKGAAGPCAAVWHHCACGRASGPPLGLPVHQHGWGRSHPELHFPASPLQHGPALHNLLLPFPARGASSHTQHIAKPPIHPPPPTPCHSSPLAESPHLLLGWVWGEALGPTASPALLWYPDFWVAGEACG